MTAFIVSPQHLAVLFALFGQEPPLPVQDALAGISAPELRRLLGDAQPHLIEAGVLARDTAGEAELTAAAAEVLAVCFEAECVVSVQPGEAPSSVVYSRGELGVAVASVDDYFTLTSLPGSRACEEWLLSALGPPTADENGEEFSCRLSTDALGQLLEVLFQADHERSAQLAEKLGVDQHKLNETLVMIGAEDAPMIAVAATRPGILGTIMTRLRMCESGAWALKFVMLSDDDVAEIGWYSYSALPALVGGFGDDRDDLSGERREEA